MSRKSTITLPPNESRNKRHEKQVPLAEQRRRQRFYHFCVRPYFALLHILYTLTYYMKRPFVFWRNPRAYYISFGSTGEYHPRHIVAEAKQSGLFYDVRGWTPDALAGTKFWRDNGDFCLQTIRGFGYWTWKAPIIQQTLKKMRDGDILLYTDAGSGLLFDEAGKREWQKACAQVRAHKLLVFSRVPTPISNWCKNDAFAFLRIPEALGQQHHQAEGNTLMLVKHPHNYRWFRHWRYLLASPRYRFLVDDSPSHRANSPAFVNHRHDQSLLALLLSRYARAPLHRISYDPEQLFTFPLRLQQWKKDKILQQEKRPFADPELNKMITFPEKRDIINRWWKIHKKSNINIEKQTK